MSKCMLNKGRFMMVGVLALPLSMPIDSEAQVPERAGAASIVFLGTVETPGAVSMSSLAASKDTCVVAVAEVLRKPEAVALLPGDRVTVLTDGVAELKEGERALFYTEGVVFGESLALRVLAWEPAPTAESLASSGGRAQLTAKVDVMRDRELKARTDRAQVIVVGRVTRIQTSSLRALGAAPESEMISEHAPDWQEAVIEVESVVKGASGTREVLARFPGSLDVMWADYPKFKEGQEGIFLLQKESLSGTSRALVQGIEVDAYMATSRADVLDKGMAAKVRELIQPPR